MKNPYQYFTKRRTLVRARQWSIMGDDKRVAAYVWSKGRCKQCGKSKRKHGWLKTGGGGQMVCPGDWIVMDDKTGVGRCDGTTFQRLYELANYLDFYSFAQVGFTVCFDETSLTSALDYLKVPKKARPGFPLSGWTLHHFVAGLNRTLHSVVCMPAGWGHKGVMELFDASVEIWGEYCERSGQTIPRQRDILGQITRGLIGAYRAGVCDVERITQPTL